MVADGLSCFRPALQHRVLCGRSTLARFGNKIAPVDRRCAGETEIEDAPALLDATLAGLLAGRAASAAAALA